MSGRLTVVIPTFNEAANLPSLVARLAATVPEAEILVVDDASPDGTAAVARDLGRRHPLRVIERSGERGLATAVVRGLREASNDVCAVMDADLSHPPELLPKLRAAVEDGADIAVGSRYVPGGEIDGWPLRRRVTSMAGTWLARPLTPVRDPMSGFFCLRRGRIPWHALKPRGFKILLEILARSPGWKAVEVPIRFEDRAAGGSKFGPRERRDFLRQLGDLYRELQPWPLRVSRSGLVWALGVSALVALAPAWSASSMATRLAYVLTASASAAPLRNWVFSRMTLPRFVAGWALGVSSGLAVLASLPRPWEGAAGTLAVLGLALALPYAALEAVRGASPSARSGAAVREGGLP